MRLNADVEPKAPEGVMGFDTSHPSGEACSCISGKQKVYAVRADLGGTDFEALVLFNGDADGAIAKFRNEVRRRGIWIYGKVCRVKKFRLVSVKPITKVDLA